MSTQTPIYILWGLMLPYPKSSITDDYYEKLEPYMDNAFKPDTVNAKNDTTILFDGMGGKYIAVGHVLARSGPNGDDLGTHTIPSTQGQGDPYADPKQLMASGEWRKGIEATLEETGLDADAQGYSFGWHVIQHYR